MIRKNKALDGIAGKQIRKGIVCCGASFGGGDEAIDDGQKISSLIEDGDALGFEAGFGALRVDAAEHGIEFFASGIRRQVASD